MCTASNSIVIFIPHILYLTDYLIQQVNLLYFSLYLNYHKIHKLLPISIEQITAVESRVLWMIQPISVCIVFFKRFFHFNFPFFISQIISLLHFHYIFFSTEAFLHFYILFIHNLLSLKKKANLNCSFFFAYALHFFI